MTEDPSNVGPIKALSEAWWAQRSPEVRARRCRAHRKTGAQCLKSAMEGQQVCRFHGGAAPQAKAKARQRIDEAADRMAARLLGFAEREDVPAYVALDAVKDALNRAGLAPPTHVEVGVRPYEEVLANITGISDITRAESRRQRGLLVDELPPAPVDAIDAELVDDPAQEPPERAADADGERLPDPPTGEVPDDRSAPPAPRYEAAPRPRGFQPMERATTESRVRRLRRRG